MSSKNSTKKLVFEIVALTIIIGIILYMLFAGNGPQAGTVNTEDEAKRTLPPVEKIDSNLGVIVEEDESIESRIEELLDGRNIRQVDVGPYTTPNNNPFN